MLVLHYLRQSYNAFYSLFSSSLFLRCNNCSKSTKFSLLPAFQARHCPASSYFIPRNAPHCLAVAELQTWRCASLSSTACVRWFVLECFLLCTPPVQLCLSELRQGACGEHDRIIKQRRFLTETPKLLPPVAFLSSALLHVKGEPD